MHRSLAILGLCLAAASVSVSCRTPQLAEPPPIQLAGASPETARSAVLRGMQHRGWRLVEEDRAAERIRARIDVRGKHQGIVDIFYGGDQIRFHHVSSEGLKEKGVGDDRTIHRNYNSWLALLAADIDNELQLTGAGASVPE
jgi:hypothetical protein